MRAHARHARAAWHASASANGAAVRSRVQARCAAHHAPAMAAVPTEDTRSPASVAVMMMAAGLVAAGCCAMGANMAHAEPSTVHRVDMLLRNSREELEASYEILDEIIGEGGYCVVHKGLDRKTGEPVAIKVLSKKDTSAREFWTEVDVLKTAGNHANIMKLRDVFETTEYWYIVQELASDGELFDHLIANGAYSEQQASEAIRDLCQALYYLHRKGIVHGDIKPENILLHEGRMCLVDFGVSFRMGERFYKDSQLTGTVAYSAPESLVHPGLNPLQPQQPRLGPKADMFALGVVLYILLCGSHPFDTYNNLTDDEIRQRIIKGKFRRSCRAWQSISPSARDLIEKLLETDPKKRLGSKEALRHPWLMKNAKLSTKPMPDSAELLENFQRGRRRLRASILGALLLEGLEDDEADKPVRSGKKLDSAWGLSSSVEALNEKTRALLATLDVFDRDHKGFITKTDLERVGQLLGRRHSEAELNEMLVGSTGDPEQKAASVESIDYENVKMAISTLRSASYEPGEAIIREGHSTGHHVYLLLDGEVEVSCKNPIAQQSEASASKESPQSQSTKGKGEKPNEAVVTEEDYSIILKRLQKGSFFGEVELLRPDGRLHPRIATYRCAPGPDAAACKVLQLVADDFLNVSGMYSTINDRVEASARHHTQQQLIKCVEASKGSVKKRTFEPGEFVYREGESCDSFFILLDGEVEVLKQHEKVVVEELRTGAYFPLGVSGQTKRCKMVTRHSSVRCKTPVQVIEIGGETFRSFLHSHNFMAAYFSAEVKRREQQRLDKLEQAQ